MITSSRIQTWLGNYLHGPAAHNSMRVHPLTLRFLGPDQEHLHRMFDEQRCQRILIAQAAILPVVIPFLLTASTVKMLGPDSQWHAERLIAERLILGSVMLVLPFVLGWFSHCVPGGRSLTHWHIIHLLVLFTSLAGASIIDDHSGPLLEDFILGRTVAVPEQRVGSVYAWVPCIVGMGYVAAYSIFFPAHPLILSGVALQHLFWYFLPILVSEEGDDGKKLSPQMGAVAVIDFFIIVGRLRVEFTEKLLLANTELLNRATETERVQRDTLESFCGHVVDHHMWLAADANLVIQEDRGKAFSPRGIWPEEDDRAGMGPLFFQDLLATANDREIFQSAVATSQLADAGPLMQLLPCTLKMHDQGMMQSTERDCDVFLIRCGVGSGIDSCPEWSYMLGVRARQSSSQGPRQEQGDSTLANRGIQAARIQDALERESSDSSTYSESLCEEGLLAELGSTVGSQLTVPKSCKTATGELLEQLRAGLLQSDQATRLIQFLGKSEGWLIPSRKVDLGDGCSLGSGGFGYVTRGRFFGVPAAIKRPHLSTGVKALCRQINELRLLRHIRHPHIACFYGAVASPRLPGSVALVLEFIDGPTLCSYVKHHLQENSCNWCRHRVLGGICLGLMYLHERCRRVVHGDLKPVNVMVSVAGEDPQAKIVDFGLSRKLEAGSEFLGVTHRWCSPEALRGDNVFTRAGDVFSFAYVIYFCLSGRQPWEGLSRDKIKKAAKYQVSPLLLDDTRLELLTPMLQVDPKKRCRIRQVHQIVSKLSVLDCGRTAFSRFEGTHHRL